MCTKSHLRVSNILKDKCIIIVNYAIFRYKLKTILLLVEKYLFSTMFAFFHVEGAPLVTFLNDSWEKEPSVGVPWLPESGQISLLNSGVQC